MTTRFVLFSVRIPYQFFNSLCCRLGNTPKIQYVLNFLLSLFFVLDVFTKKTSIEDHQPNIWLGLGLIHVVSIELIFFWWCVQPPLLLASCWGWSSPGTRPMCKAADAGYRQRSVHPQSKDSWKSFTFGDVWCEWWAWVEPWIPEWPWVIIPSTSSKENDSKSHVFSNVFLEFPDIFLTAPPESRVHVLVQQNC